MCNNYITVSTAPKAMSKIEGLIMSDNEMVVETEVNESAEVVEQVEEVENEEVLDETSSNESEETLEDNSHAEEETLITIGDEEAPASEQTSAPEWVKELRKTSRETQKRNKELEQKLEALTATEVKTVTLGPKPTLEGLDYDSEKYEASLDTWYNNKREHDMQQEQVKQEQDTQAKVWQGTLESYATKKQALNIPDYDEAEHTVLETLSETQQGMILQGADDPALLVYALGKNPKRAKELADIKDPVKFAFAVARLETTVKKTSRKKAPPAEKTVTGGAPASANDSTLDRLRAEADKSGDMSKVIAYKAKKKK